MLKQLTIRQKVALIVTFAIILLAGTMFAWQIYQKKFVASEEPAKVELFVRVERNGVAADGLLEISNGCSSSPVPSQDGSFYCELRSDSDPAIITLESMRFADFTNLYDIPLRPDGDIKRPVFIPNSKKIYLRITLNDKEGVKIYQYVGEKETDVTKSGIEF